MAGNTKSYSICFDFQKTFHSIDVFCTLSCLYVRLGFRLLGARLLFILLPFIRSGFGSLIGSFSNSDGNAKDNVD